MNRKPKDLIDIPFIWKVDKIKYNDDKIYDTIKDEAYTNAMIHNYLEVRTYALRMLLVPIHLLT
tara:strand:+ start:41 stop:232 length:192 start_codon:yes stop_codon:yes gene_type:complete